jgi:hypothetical protein
VRPVQGRGRIVDTRRRVGPFGETEIVDHVLIAKARGPEQEWRHVQAAVWYRDGVTITEIGRRLGVSRQRAQVFLDRADVPRSRVPRR